MPKLGTGWARLLKKTMTENVEPDEPNLATIGPTGTNPPAFISEHNFTLHSVGKLQKNVGGLNANVVALEAKVGSLEKAIGKVEDDVKGINTKIAWVMGAAATLATLIAILAFVISNIPWDKIKIG